MIEVRSRAIQRIDSGAPTQRFAEWFDGISRLEAIAILSFLCRLRDLYGADFPDGALDTSIAYWTRQ
jgi:hypothetical protein